jgi:hypothetical protein
MFKERPSNKNLYEPKNPEYELANSFINELHEIVTPNILYFATDMAATMPTMDNVDLVYGETKQKIKFFPPKKIDAFVEANPILEELTQMGLAQIEELNVIVSIDNFLTNIAQEPKGGDVFKISHMEQGKPQRDVWYTVTNALPINLFNWQYLNYIIHSQQTRMADVPADVKFYLNLE